MAHLLPSTKGALTCLAFVQRADTPVVLIEVTSEGAWRRVDVTKELIETYIEHDFEVGIAMSGSTSGVRILQSLIVDRRT